MAKKQVNTSPAYKILHSAVGQHYRGEVVQFGDEIDTDRLLAIGAIEATDEQPTDPYLTDPTLNPVLASGSDNAASQRAAALANGSEPTGPAADMDKVNAALDPASAA